MLLLIKLFLLMLMLFKHGSCQDLSIEQGYMNWVKNMGSMTHIQVNKGEKNKLVETCLTITVDKDPNVGDFVTVQQAVDSIPSFNLCRVVIYIHEGIYREKVVIPVTKAYVSLEGRNSETTIIEWNDTAAVLGPNQQPLGTYGSATVIVNSPYFIAKNITFKNVAPLPPSRALRKQAVALRISEDMGAFIGCKFIGAQDTLYDHAGRHYFKNCYIEGSIDFIFGDGLSLYEGCHLHTVANHCGSLTAQSRENMLEETGFSFVNCTVTGSGALYLGRAWGTFSRVVFAYTYMHKIITPSGWDNWGDKNREMTVFYGQYKCFGPGADYGGRVSWSRELTEQEAQPFISLSFIDGHEWLHDL